MYYIQFPTCDSSSMHASFFDLIYPELVPSLGLIVSPISDHSLSRTESSAADEFSDENDT